MKPEPAPVVTMDLDTGRLFLNGTYVGYIDEDMPGVSFGTFALTFEAADLRALADFLDQLAGANLLSEVVEG